MENGQTEGSNTLPGKKEMKHQLAEKIEAALPDLKAMLGDKKFANRIKKAAKLLMEGLHKEDIAKEQKQPKKAITKQAAINKTAAKKVTAKVAATKKAKAVSKKHTGK